MKQKITLAFTAFFGLMILGLTPVTMAATSKDAVCEGAGLTADVSGCTKTTGPDVNSALRTIVNILSVIVGIIAVVMIIVAGVKFVTSGGAADKVTSAKNTTLYAVIGLVVVALAQVIVRFVLSKATK